MHKQRARKSESTRAIALPVMQSGLAVRWLGYMALLLSAALYIAVR